MSKLGDRLTELRKRRRDTTVDNILEFIHKKVRGYEFFTRQAYRNYETGRTEPSIEILHSLARFYGTAPSDFFRELNYLATYAFELSVPFINKKDFRFHYHHDFQFSIIDDFCSLSFTESDAPSHRVFDHQIISITVNKYISANLKIRLTPVIEMLRTEPIKISPYAEEQLLQKVLAILSIDPGIFNEALTRINWIESYGQISIGTSEDKNLIFDYDSQDKPPKELKIDPPQQIKTAKLLWFLYKNKIRLQHWPDKDFEQAIYNKYYDRVDTAVPEDRIPEVEFYLFEIMGYDYNQVKRLLISMLETNSNNPDFLKNTEDNISRLTYQLLYYIAEEFPSYHYYQGHFNYDYGNKDFFATAEYKKALFSDAEEQFYYFERLDLVDLYDFPVNYFISLRKRKKTSPANPLPPNENEYQSAFPIILKTARQSMFPDKSAKEFAEVCKINYQTYNKYETGTNRPNNETLLYFAKKLNLSLDELIGFFHKEQVSALLTPLLYPNETISEIDEQNITISTATTRFNLPVSEFAKHYIIARYECHDAIIKVLKEEFFEHNNSLDVNDYELTASTNMDLIALLKSNT